MEDGKENCEVLTPGHDMAIAYVSSHSNCGYLQDTCTRANQSQYWSEKGSQNPSEGALGSWWLLREGEVFFFSLRMWPLIRCPHLSGWPHIVHRCIVLVGHTRLLIIKINMMIMKTWGWERDEVVSSGTLEGVNGGGWIWSKYTVYGSKIIKE